MGHRERNLINYSLVPSEFVKLHIVKPPVSRVSSEYPRLGQENVVPRIKLLHAALSRLIDKEDEFLNTLPHNRSKIDARVLEGMECISDYRNYDSPYEIQKQKYNWSRAKKIVAQVVEPELWEDGLMREFTVERQTNKELRFRGPFRVLTVYKPGTETKGDPELVVFFVDPYHLLFPNTSDRFEKLSFNYLKTLSYTDSLEYHFSTNLPKDIWAD